MESSSSTTRTQPRPAASLAGRAASPTPAAAPESPSLPDPTSSRNMIPSTHRHPRGRIEALSRRGFHPSRQNWYMFPTRNGRGPTPPRKRRRILGNEHDRKRGPGAARGVTHGQGTAQDLLPPDAG